MTLDLASEDQTRRVRTRDDIKISSGFDIHTDAHSTEQLYFMRYGIDQAPGWLEKRHVLNAMTQPQFEIWLKQRRQSFNKAV